MKFTVIQNFSEAVDPEERKLRLHKIAQYAKRHALHARKIGRAASQVHKLRTHRLVPQGVKSKLGRLWHHYGKEEKPHMRRHLVAKLIVQKFRWPKTSSYRKDISKRIRNVQYLHRGH